MSDERWDSLRRSYDTVATAYEERFLDELSAKPRDREILASFSAKTADPVIELGCGPGQVGAFVRAAGRQVVGIDLSVGMSRLARGRLDGAAAGDLRSLPLQTGSAGGVLAFYSLIHLPRQEVGVALEEVARVLRPGGTVLVAVHEGDGEVVRDTFLDHEVPFVATLFRLDELSAAAERAGLAVTFAERRQPYPGESGTVRLLLGATRS